MRVFLQGADPAARVLHVVAVARPLEVAPVALRKGSHVHHEHLDVQLRLVLLGHDGFFGGVHTAHRRAVVVALIPRADALQKRDALRRLLIRRALHVPRRRSRRRQQPLELQRRDHVRVASQPVFLRQLRPVHLVARRQDHRPHLHRLLPRHHVVIDGLHPAGVHAGQTLRANAALQTALGLGPRLVLGQAQHNFAEAGHPLFHRQQGRFRSRLRCDLADLHPLSQFLAREFHHRRGRRLGLV